MIDPSALYESARGVYGDAKMARSYGQLMPVPAERVLVTHGCTLAKAELQRLLQLDIELNAQGLLIWRQRIERPASRQQEQK